MLSKRSSRSSPTSVLIEPMHAALLVVGRYLPMSQYSPLNPTVHKQWYPLSVKPV